MSLRNVSRLARTVTLGAVLAAAAAPASAIVPKQPDSYAEGREFFLPELYLSSANVPLQDALDELPNREAWQAFERQRDAAGQGRVSAFIDPRSGVATNILGSFPLIPGDGAFNRVSLSDLGRRVGRALTAVDAAAVADAARALIVEHEALLGLDARQVGELRAVQVAPELWQVSAPQVVDGVTVRDALFALTISHGNAVLMGTQTWGNVRARTQPTLTADEALEIGFAYAGGRSWSDDLQQKPQLELLPAAPPELQSGEAFAGPLGQGYRHRLAWSFIFQRPPDLARWEALVDAHSGEMLAFQDKNHYVERFVRGGIYPLTNTGICPTPQTCGVMQPASPMSFADTAFAAPDDFTNSAGIYNYTSGTATTTLTGRYVDIVDACGAISASSATGDIDLGGTNGQHDCTTPGFGGPGNTPASRSAFYEVNKLAEMARGYLPTNTWLQSRLTTNVNINLTCNAFWNGVSINFYRSGGGCGNTGEIAAVFDHEWGHGIDDFDANGVLSNSSEAYADIAAIYRLQASCVGHGFSLGAAGTCGLTADGTGPNRNEAQTGAAHCNTDCSGVRDADWGKHLDNTPDTALGFVCTSCLASSGPCGRQVHCAAAPARQAAWDFVARDLRNPPFNLDSQTAFVVGNRVFYLGSGNIGLWHACTCGASSDGCGATNGYMQWLAADDDNGNVSDGTPHMTALHAAFNRHGIACATPTPVNSGCAGAPTGAASLTATGGAYSASLSWTGVAGATSYQVFRSEGYAGCDFGKTKIAETAGTTFTDTQVANGREYYYNVVARGSSSACFGPVSNCVSVTPGGAPTPDFSVACSPSSVSVAQGGSANTTCTVTSLNGFSAAVALSCSGLPAGVSCAFAPGSVTPPSGGSASSTLTISASGAAATGTTGISVNGTSGADTRTAGVSVTVTGVTPVTLTFTSIAAEDGRTQESSELSNVGGASNSTATGTAALRAGDLTQDRQYRSIVSFDTSSIPDGATITSATLRLVRGGVTGTNPFTTHGTCQVDIVSGAYGGSTALVASDFEAASTATAVGSLSSPAANGSPSTAALNAAGLAAINKTGTTQLKFYFTLDDNDDGGNDYVGFYSGDNGTAANRPTLTVTYTP
jgi:hypothetical protein